MCFKGAQNDHKNKVHLLSTYLHTMQGVWWLKYTMSLISQHAAK